VCSSDLIEDNGSGLTEDEIGDYLATIGRSYTRQLGENLSFLSPEQAEKLIGQFGLGFLSAFLVASEVTFITRSVKPDSPTLQWHSSGDVHYDLKPAPERAIGSRVELKIKPAAAFLLNRQVLAETAQQFADFLPIPVYMEGDTYPINAQTAPWEALDPTLAIQDYIQRVYNVEHPLAVIQLKDHLINLGHDEISIPMNGFVFVPQGSVVSIMEYGDMSIYIRRMFICNGHRDLLPSWARFVRGVIDCPQLQPTASREDIRQEDNFTFVQQALEQQLLEGLQAIAVNTPSVWRQIVQGYRNVIMGWATRDNDFFESVADIVTFRTTRGQMSLPDYLDLTGGTLYYVTREMGTRQEQLLGEGFGMPVIDASHFVDPVFLQRYADFRPNTHLVQLDNDANKLMRQTQDPSLRPILEFYRSKGVKAHTVTFKPEAIPAVLIFPKDAEFIKETREALDKGEVPGPFAGLVGSYLNNMPVDEASLNGTLHINIANPMIQQLAAMSDSANRDAVLWIIYQMARLLAGRMLDNPQVVNLFEDSAASLKTLLGE
jgi:molecular chaperone HtpG